LAQGPNDLAHGPKAQGHKDAKGRRMGCGGSNAAHAVAPGEAVPKKERPGDAVPKQGAPKQGAGLNEEGDEGEALGTVQLDKTAMDALEAGFQHFPRHWGAVARAMDRGYLREALREFET